MDVLHEFNCIEGTVEAVVFYNEENGYAVIRVDVGAAEPVTAVGCMPEVAPGEGLTLYGDWVRHATYGDQFKAETSERTLPSDEKSVFAYLSSGAVRGVGAATARRILEEFGAEALAILAEHPEQLTRIRGVTQKRALAIGEAFRRQMGMRLLLEFFSEHGIALSAAMPLYRRFGPDALERLKSNPYLMLDEETGADFSAADTLALSLGMEGNSPTRVEAGLLFELTHNLNNGHAFLPREKLLWATGQLLELEPSELADGLDALTARGATVEEQVAGERACYLARIHWCECEVAERLARDCRTELCPREGLETVIDRIEAAQGIAYAPQQREALALAARRQVMLLTGGPGTGKTTSLRGLLTLFDHLGLETALAAPTGRAAKRLGEACGVEASTIHRLLETRYDPAAGRLTFARDENNPLRVDAVIIDETSMVDIVLMQALLAALRGDCRLILVGDPDQLPSVGPGNLLSDLVRSELVPTVRLTEIFRQAAESAIVRNAHAVNRGEMPELEHREGDFFFLRRNDPARVVETIVALCRDRLPKNMGIEPHQIQVLSPTRKRQTGTHALNEALQAALNPPAKDKEERAFGSHLFRAGDRVMQIQNNYDLMWVERSSGVCGMGVFNGDIGVVERMEPGGVLCVDFAGRTVEYPPECLGQLEPAYAITVHKAQGSEYRAVIFAALDGSPMLFSRGVLYTAITRAQELFIAVGSGEVIGAMTANNRRQKRYSGLRARLARLSGGEGPA